MKLNLHFKFNPKHHLHNFLEVDAYHLQNCNNIININQHYKIFFNLYLTLKYKHFQMKFQMNIKKYMINLILI